MPPKKFKEKNKTKKICSKSLLRLPLSLPKYQSSHRHPHSTYSLQLPQLAHPKIRAHKPKIPPRFIAAIVPSFHSKLSLANSSPQSTSTLLFYAIRD